MKLNLVDLVFARFFCLQKNNFKYLNKSVDIVSSELLDKLMDQNNVI